MKISEAYFLHHNSKTFVRDMLTFEFQFRQTKKDIWIVIFAKLFWVRILRTIISAGTIF